MAPAPGPYVYGATGRGEPDVLRRVLVSSLRRPVVHLRPGRGPWYNIAVSSVPMAVMQVPVHTEGGRGHDGRYIPPRLWYEDGGGRGRDRGHGHHDD